jgi:hypothetical protein
MVRLERHMAAQLRHVFDDAASGVINEMSRIGRLPTNDMQRAQVMRHFQEAVPRLGQLVQADAASAARLGRNQAINTLRQSGVPGLRFTDVPNHLLQKVLDSSFVASNQTMRRLSGNLRSVFEQGFREGWGISNFTDHLDGVFDGMRRYELDRIARTQVQSFVNESAHETLREHGVRYEMWVTAEDDRVRSSHEEVAGEITALDTEFSNGLKYPLDHSGPIEEWVNCRCRAVPFIPPLNARPPHSGPFFEDELFAAKRHWLAIANKHRMGEHDQSTHASGGGAGETSSAMYASKAEREEAARMAQEKIANAPAPSEKAVEKARRELELAKQGKGRAGGDSRGGSADDRRKQRQNLYKEFGGEEKGYVVCHVTGLKMHWADPEYKGTKYDPKKENPNGYPAFERGKIFVKEQGGGYQLPNLLPESFEANRVRGAEFVRPENTP